MVSDFIQVTVASASEEEAHKIAEALVTRRLAASCWVSGPITSRYWWKGKAEKAQEWICTAKTRTGLYIEVEQAIKEIHSYEVPGILATPVVKGSQAYFEWINHETGLTNQEDQTRISKEQLIHGLINAHENVAIEATAAYERGIRRTEDAWGPREILAHIAGWEVMAIARIPQILAGVPPVRYETAEQHANMDNAINATVVTMIGDQPFEAIRDIFRQCYQRDAQLLRGLDEALFVPDSYVYERTRAAIDHCYEHAQALARM
jgi:periplasmic divalent cation tolerance protein